MADEAEARLGARLGNYILRGIIGRGGMGVVYRAEHAYIQKFFAVKVLHAHNFEKPDARDRFLHEARTASVVDHPNIVGVTDFGEAPDGTVFLVMAHVEGVPLDRVLRHERRLPLFRTLVVLSQVTRALAATHAKGVIHRDLKPENLMLARRAGRRKIVQEVLEDSGVFEQTGPELAYDFVTILDFGAAKFFDQSAVALGEGGVVVGTPAYMAPETARTGVADARSDIYSVGVLFYEMLTGHVPFDGDEAVTIMMKHVNNPVPSPRGQSPSVEITVEAERTILKALEKDPAHRQQSMDELHADLQRCYGRVRFRRETPDESAGDANRRPIPLTQVKRRPASPPSDPNLPAVTEPQLPVVSAMMDPSTPSAPIPLMRRKSGRHPTLPLGAGVPLVITDRDPPDDK